MKNYFVLFYFILNFLVNTRRALAFVSKLHTHIQTKFIERIEFASAFVQFSTFRVSR